jgi:DNA end-binding protein Ku
MSSRDRPSGRAIWRGSLDFGLVQIPVSLVTAETSNELSFHELDKRDRSRVGYERINKTTGRPVEWRDIVKGYEIEKGRFVVLDPEDFQKANVAATQTIDIVDFVPAREIPPMFFERPYYIVPEKRGQKAYAVLREALAAKGYAGVALVVIRTRQHLSAVVPQAQSLVLELLRFAHELKPLKQPADAPPKATAKEIALADTLIEGMSSRWDPTKYRDSYRDDLLAAIRQKDRTGHIKPASAPADRAAKVVDLAALLRTSIATMKKGRHPAKKRRVA